MWNRNKYVSVKPGMPLAPLRTGCATFAFAHCETRARSNKFRARLRLHPLPGELKTHWRPTLSHWNVFAPPARVLFAGSAALPPGVSSPWPPGELLGRPQAVVKFLEHAARDCKILL